MVVRRNRNRRGLTLPEVLVTLAIVATLAAVLLPALNSQLSKGDAGRLSSDLVSLQTAIGAFTSDVRRFPKELTQLNTPIATNQQDLLGQTYPQSLVNRWRGPYLGKSLVSNTLPSAFGASILNAFANESDGVNNYVAVKFSPITASDFEKVDLIIDEQASSTTGQLRWANGSGTGTFFAVPIQ
jgi:prepilin-type N-terminal cleavage/methylation domain-containing protein